MIIKLKKLNNNYIFENIVAAIFVVFGIIGWQFNYFAGTILITIFSICLLLIFKDFKFVIPAFLVMLFSIGEGFEVETFPFEVVIPVAIYVVVIVIFSIVYFKKQYLKNIKSCVGMIILAVSFIIPIFWVELINSSNTIFYVMYFSWLLYLILYLILCINVRKNSFKMLVFSFSWLAMLISYELISSVIKLKLENPDQSILSFWYYIGWGLCNEAGIMLCFFMPFIIYEIIKSNKLYLFIIAIFKIFILLFAILLTTSRGSLLFGGIEFFLFLIILCYLKYDMKQIKICVMFLLLVLSFFILMAITNNKLIDDIIQNIFNLKFDDNGRDSIWKSGLKSWTASFRNVVFGSGIVSELRDLVVFDKTQYIYLVYHSTVLEVLVSAGLIGLCGLIIHFYEKYKLLFKKGKDFLLIFGCGFLVVDLYGLIDNTYGMYYYMIPLCLLMTVFNVNDDFEIYPKTHHSNLDLPLLF